MRLKQAFRVTNYVQLLKKAQGLKLYPPPENLIAENQNNA
jgi:hypothetical protein